MASPIRIQNFPFPANTRTTLSVLRDDRSAVGLGTKVRKFFGIHAALQSQNVRSVLLQGEFHGNALAAFSFLFRVFGYTVRSIAYSRDLHRVTANSVLVRRHSHFLELSESRTEWKERISRLKTEECVLIPEYGLCRAALEGLDSLWERIPISRYDRFVIDVGSGLTYLSALRFFGNRIPVYGVAIGLSKSKLASWLREKKNALGLEFLRVDEDRILKPKPDVGFGAKNMKILEYSKCFYEMTRIPVEPIYSARTLFAIEARIRSGEWGGKTLYLHQGGLWNFLDQFVESFTL
uniref:1-aminocyclopropane-1-carboxylate deaminase n=1 Tax=Leptospira ellisii TaxID=2023197 RepID=A0A2N0B6X3_9LEPT|nr:1-aminocyclopropane-1-carboxylate deaminase [Leptospira ellisii]